MKSDYNLPYDKDDQTIYESGKAALENKFLIVTVDSTYDAENNPGIERFIESVKCVKTGTNTWLVNTDLPPAQIVNSIRRHLGITDAVYAFTVSSDLAWAGQRFVRKFFELCGARIQHWEEIPPPAGRANEP